MEVLWFLFYILLIVLLFQWISNLKTVLNICRRRKKILSTFERLGIPGPKPSFWTGNIRDLLKYPNELPLIKAFGPICGIYYGLLPLLIVSDPKLLKIIEVKEAQNFHKRNPIIPNIAVQTATLQKSTVLISGSRWKQSRDSMTGAYTTCKLKMIATTMNGVIGEHLSQIKSKVEKCQSVDMTEIINNLLVDVIFQTSFGAKISKNKHGNFNDVIESIYLSLSTNILNPINFLSTCFPELASPLYVLRQFADATRYLWNITSAKYSAVLCDKILSLRLAVNKDYLTDILQIMINRVYGMEGTGKNKTIEQDNSLLSYDDILGNCYYLIIAAQETVRSSILYSLFYIAKELDVQEKLRQEINDFTEQRKDISYAAFSEMKYLDQIFSEVLRLHPPAPNFINRITEKDFEYKNMLIPKEITIFVPQMAMNRNPEYWDRPDEFRPERFEDKSSIDPYLYQPFGIGPRHCAGMRYAQLMGKLILARIVKSFHLRLVEEVDEIEVDVSVVINRPKKRLYLKVTPV